MALQVEKGNSMVVLQDETVWICDTVVSMHVKWSSKCTRKVQETQTYSLGHTQVAAELDIPGVFTRKDVHWG